MKKIIFILVFVFINLSFAFKVEPFGIEEMKKYCTECHFVYQAEFLPKRSWKKMFKNEELAHHFGKKVVLNDEIKKDFLRYYLLNASDEKNTKASRKIDKSISSDKTYLRVSKVPYIVSKHDDLPEEMIVDNQKVKTYGNCTACHDAKNGDYDEDNVKVPNWEKRFFFGWSKKD